MSFLSKLFGTEEENLDIKFIDNSERNILLEKHRKDLTNYVFSYGIPKDDIIDSIRNFQKYKASKKSEHATKLNILICQTDSESFFILFSPTIHPYLFYSFLSFMDSDNSVGFINKHNNTFMIKREEGSDYIYGTAKNGENIEICVVDGEINFTDENKVPYFESILDFSKISNLYSVDISVEDVGDFGNPEFKINT